MSVQTPLSPVNRSLSGNSAHNIPVNKIGKEKISLPLQIASYCEEAFSITERVPKTDPPEAVIEWLKNTKFIKPWRKTYQLIKIVSTNV